MKTLFLALLAVGVGLVAPVEAADTQPPPVYKLVAPAVPVPPPEPTPVAPPAAPAKLGAAELEKLVAPIALYPDPLLAVLLPASVYPLEIVQAARFVKDTNNLAKLEAQPWDSNVKQLARFPTVIEKLNDDLSWTISLGHAFREQPAELMEGIQVLRKKAEKAGTLQSSAQQVVVVTNAVVERTFEQQIVYVTNSVVQIQPANPEVIYVPQYNPSVVYSPPATYVYDPLVPLVTFGVGIGLGAIIANNCDWYYGGVWVGGWGGYAGWGWGGSGYYYPPYYPPPPGCRPPPYYPPPGYRPPPAGYRPPGFPPPGYRPPPGAIPQPTPTSAGTARLAPLPAGTGQRWQPDQSRLQSFGPPTTTPSTRTLDARGWGSGTAPRPSAPGSGATGFRPSPTPSPGPGVSRPAPAAPQYRPGSSIQRPYQPSAPRDSAFRGVGSGSTTRGYSSRGMTSRGSSGSAPSSGGSRGTGGGGRTSGGRGGR